MSNKAKGWIAAIIVIVALGIVGHMDERDAQCDWNGCHTHN
jgi:hypothetical protein